MKLVSQALMRLVAAGVLCAAVLPAVALAASDGPAGREPGEVAVPGDAPSTRQRAALTPAASEQELDDIAAFMRQFAPARWAALEALPEAGAVRRSVMIYVVARWRHLQMLREEDTELYDLKVQQMAVEDAIYGLLARTRTPAEREPLRKILREKVAELVKLGLKEREHRIERLRQALKVEEDRLAKDQGATARMVEQRVNAFVTDGPVTLHSDMPRGPRRPGPGATPGADEEPALPPGK